MMQILINHADKTINIPTACSAYFLSPLTRFQLICCTPHGCGASGLQHSAAALCSSSAPGTHALDVGPSQRGSVEWEAL